MACQKCWQIGQNNEDISKRYTHDTIRPLSYYKGAKKVDLGFVGSCMVHKGDLKIVSENDGSTIPMELHLLPTDDKNVFKHFLHRV